MILRKASSRVEELDEARYVDIRLARKFGH
jgi:hypothetical protein